jgi:hypothetical protein
MNFEKLGGIASIVEVFLSVFLIAFAFILFPRLGLGSLSDLADPIKNMAAWEASPTTFYLRGIDVILWCPTFIILVLALRNLFLNDTPILMMISVIGATIAATLWLFSGVIEIAGKEQIALAKDISAFRAITVTYNCLAAAGDFAFGWVILLIGSAGIKTSKLPRILSWILIIEGICFVLFFAVKPLGILGLILAIISNLWLGIILISGRNNQNTAKEQ